MTIVVGVDGSAVSQQALRWAIGEGRLRGSAVRAVYAWDIPSEFGIPEPRLGDSVVGAGAIDLEDLHRSAQSRVGEVVDRTPGSAGVERVAVQGPPAEVLVGQATDADLLVVGSRGAGAIANALLGSVSQTCMQRASCPVVVVRGSEAEQDERAKQWRPREAFAREFAQNRETWKALERLGVAEGATLRLEFLYETGGEAADGALAEHLRTEHDYEVEVEDGGVTGSTKPMPVSPQALDEWVTRMVIAGHQHGNCLFDGWTATVAAGGVRSRSSRLAGTVA